MIEAVSARQLFGDGGALKVWLFARREAPYTFALVWPAWSVRGRHFGEETRGCSRT
jgi:hypothetical protein